MKTIEKLIFKTTAVFLTLSSQLVAVLIPVGPPPNSIQTAIDSANNGDVIQLSAGTYIEEIKVINKSIDLRGMGRDLTFIQSPNASVHLTNKFNFGSAAYWCVVMIDNQLAPASQTVNIRDLTVDGSNQQDTTVSPFYGNPNRFFAVGYHNANGTIDNIHTTNTRQTSNFNELAGGGIINASDTGSVAFTVSNSFVDLYQRIGIDCRGSALTASVNNTHVERGFISTPPIGINAATPNGIQFSSSTTGTISSNNVIGNIATVSGASASGIILFGAGANVSVTGNSLDSNDVGIAAVTNGADLVISNNALTFTQASGINPAEGILVQDTSGLTTLSGNILNQIPYVDMDLSSTTNQPFSLSHNQFIGSQTGLLVTGNTTSGPQITMDSDSFNGTNIYYIQEVTSPNNIWPTTASVTFDSLSVASMTHAQYLYLLSKIYDHHNDPTLGIVVP